MNAPRQAWGWVGRGIVLGLLAYAVFGPLINLGLWAVAESWYFPHKLPITYGFAYWERVFRPQGNAMASLTTSVAVALFTVIACLAVSVPAGYALARRSLPLRGVILLAFLLPQAFPSVAVYINVARIFYGMGLNGTITWSQLNRKFPEMNHTSAHLIGFLEMDDGAEVMYLATGYAVALQTSDSNHWLYTTTLTFEEPDPPYEWLVDIDAVLIGEFDADAGSAYYVAYLISENADPNR